jgi:hypothetical protein
MKQKAQRTFFNDKTTFSIERELQVSGLLVVRLARFEDSAATSIEPERR